MSFITHARHPAANASGVGPDKIYPGPRHEKPLRIGSPNTTPIPVREIEPVVEKPGKMAAKWAPTPQKMLKPDPV